MSQSHVNQDPTNENNLSRKFLGIWIPREIWLRIDISPIEKILLAEIESLGKDNSGCYASNEYLCRFMQVKERVLQRMLAHLKDLGLIKTSSFDGRTRILETVNNKTDTTTDTLEVSKMTPLKCQKRHPSHYIENIDKNSAIAKGERLRKIAKSPSLDLQKQIEKIHQITEETLMWCENISLKISPKAIYLWLKKYPQEYLNDHLCLLAKDIDLGLVKDNHEAFMEKALQLNYVQDRIDNPKKKAKK